MSLALIDYLNCRTRTDSCTLTVPQDAKKPLVWFDINAASFFESYRMEGVYPDDPETNVIYFEVNAVYLMSALGGSKKTLNHIEIKLGKQEFPYFKINLMVQTSTDQIVTISNQVPVLIIPRLGWDDFKLPHGGDFDIQAKLPRFYTLKRYISTFKNSRKIRFTAREDQTLTIEADQEPARHFSIFKVKVETCDGESSLYEGRAITALVSQKKISHWLNSISLQNKIQLYCMMRSSKMFQLIFKVRKDFMGSVAMSAEIDDECDVQDSTSSFEM